MEYDEYLEFIKGRRTIRAIKPDPIPDEMVRRMVEAARWAPTGFNMQPAEFLVVRDLELRQAAKQIIDDWIETDFYALETCRESWQGAPWTRETHGKLVCPLAPVYLFVLGDTRRRWGLPMNARFSKHKGDSIFESSLANAFMYMWLAAHSLGLAAQPVSAVKNSRVQGLLKKLLNLPEPVYIYELLAVGWSAMEGGPAAKLLRHLEEVIHFDRVADDEFLSDDDLRKQIRKLRSGNVARHTEADRLDPEGSAPRR